MSKEEAILSIESILVMVSVDVSRVDTKNFAVSKVVIISKARPGCEDSPVMTLIIEVIIDAVVPTILPMDLEIPAFAIATVGIIFDSILESVTTGETSVETVRFMALDKILTETTVVTIWRNMERDKPTVLIARVTTNLPI